MSGPILELRKVCYAYGNQLVLDGISLRVERGESVALIGPNGAGKSTLLRLAAGLLAPANGAVLLDGADLRGLAAAERARRVAVVPQEEVPAFPFRCDEVVLSGRAPHLSGLRFEGPADLAATRSAMEQTGCLELADRRITEVSGGERRRVLLARALAQATPLLLLDEPTTHLDLPHAVAVAGILARRVAAGDALLTATHDLNLAARLSHHVVLLDRGRVAAEGPPAEVLRPDVLRSVFGETVLALQDPESPVPWLVPRWPRLGRSTPPGDGAPGQACSTPHKP